MSPILTMIISGIITAAAATTTLISGAVFKRAFDQYHQAQLIKLMVAPLAESPPLQSQPPAPQSPLPSKAASQSRATTDPAKTKRVNDVNVGTVQSIDQKGGVTAGYVGSVNQKSSD